MKIISLRITGLAWEKGGASRAPRTHPAALVPEIVSAMTLFALGLDTQPQCPPGFLFSVLQTGTAQTHPTR